jgi:hypothetical protein
LKQSGACHLIQEPDEGRKLGQINPGLAWQFDDVPDDKQGMTMATSPPTSLNRADLEATLARVSSKPNVSGALVLANDTGAIIRSTLADNDLAKKYSLGVKRIRRGMTEVILELLQCSKEIIKDIHAEVQNCFKFDLI